MRLGVVILLALAAPAAWAADTVKLLPTPLELPARIGPMTHDGKPHHYDDPRLGVAYGYRAGGLLLTVYVYDAGVTGIADGDSSEACVEFENSRMGVEQAGSNKQVSLKRQQFVRLAPPADWPVAREAVYELEMNEVPTVSFVWVTGAAKHFVKLRFSVNAQLRDELPDARRAVLRALSEALRPHLGTAPPPAPDGERKSSIVVGMDAKPDDMALGFMYLGLVSAYVDQAPEASSCGGAFVPHFEAEVDLWKGALQMTGDSTSKSKLEKQMKKALAAGFLEEFLWTYARREEWGPTPPESLSLGEFEPWRRKHLKRFRMPHVGHVEIGRPRPLPLEPVE